MPQSSRDEMRPKESAVVQVPVQTYSPSVSPFVKLQEKLILKNTRGVGVVAMGCGNGRRKEEGWERAVGAPSKVDLFSQNHTPPFIPASPFPYSVISRA